MRAPLDRPNDEPGLLENAEMPGHGRLRDAEATRRLTNRGRAERETLDDATPDRMSERSKRTVSRYANNLLDSPALTTKRGRYVVLLEGKNAVI